MSVVRNRYFQNLTLSCHVNIKMRPITKNNIDKIKKHLADGVSNRKTAQRVHVSLGTVNKICRQMYPDGRIVKNGRPRKLSARDKAFCVRKLTIGGMENAVQIQKCLKNELNKDVTPRTVRNALKEAGMESVVKPKKPYLSAKNIKDRLSWAKNHLDWTLDDWKRVVWSDETKIDRFGSDGTRYAKNVKHGGGNIKLWSCILYDGVGFIVRIDENMTGPIYKSILADDLRATIDEYKVNESKMIFQHDNDPKHTSKIVTEWLSEQRYTVMSWPAQSPDLNPIENMWATLKRRLFTDYSVPPKGMLELWGRVSETWYKITKEECQNVINSMHKRCQNVIKAKGRWTKY